MLLSPPALPGGAGVDSGGHHHHHHHCCETAAEVVAAVECGGGDSSPSFIPTSPLASIPLALESDEAPAVPT